MVLYRSGGDDSPVADFLEELPEKNQAKITAAFDYLGEQGPALRRPHAAHVKGKLGAPGLAGPERVSAALFLQGGQIVVVTHGFAKKTQAIPAREIETAEKRMMDYEARFKRGALQEG